MYIVCSILDDNLEITARSYVAWDLFRLSLHNLKLRGSGHVTKS